MGLQPAVLINTDVNTFRKELNLAQWAHRLVRENTHRPDLIVLKHAQDFHNRAQKRQSTTWTKDPALVLAKRGNDVVGGYAVIDGELLGLWGFGLGDWLVRGAIKDGATHLDCFDGWLPKFYQRNGFRETLREPNYNKGGPSVVFMRLRP